MHKTKCTGADLINKIVSIMEEEIGERGGKKKVLAGVVSRDLFVSVAAE